MTTYFTYCDKNYAARAVAAVASLRSFDSKSLVHWVAFDRLAFAAPRCYALYEIKPRLFPISGKAGQDRTLIWRHTAALFLHTLRGTPPGSWTIYFDADVLFLSDPAKLMKKIQASKKSFFISRHDYAPEYDDSSSRGKFCVQFVAVKNNRAGRQFCRWWHARIQEGCTDHAGPGFGDQKCLDMIPPSLRRHQFDLPLPGTFAAPWNARLHDRSISKRQSLLYHFQGLRFFSRSWYIKKTRYRLDRAAEFLLRTYAARVAAITDTLVAMIPGFPFPSPSEKFFFLRLAKRVAWDSARLGWV